MPESFPDTLPAPNIGIGTAIESNLQRLKMDSGYVRQTKLTTLDLRTMHLVWLLNAAQSSIFQTFYRETLASGTVWFYLDLPQGDGMTTQLVRFVAGSLQRSYAGILKGVAHWNINATLETKDITAAVSEEDYLAWQLIGFDIDAYELSASHYHHAITVTLPGDN